MQSDNPIIRQFNKVALSLSDVEEIVEHTKPFLRYVDMCILENKLRLLTGEVVGNEKDVYDMERAFNEIKKKITELPEKVHIAQQEIENQEQSQQNQK